MSLRVVGVRGAPKKARSKAGGKFEGQHLHGTANIMPFVWVRRGHMYTYLLGMNTRSPRSNAKPSDPKSDTMYPMLWRTGEGAGGEK